MNALKLKNYQNVNNLENWNFWVYLNKKIYKLKNNFIFINAYILTYGGSQ